MAGTKNKFSELKIFAATKKDVDKIYSLWKELLAFHSEMSPVFKVKRGVGEIIKKDISKMVTGNDSAILILENGKGNFLGFSFMKILNKPAPFKFSRFGYIGETFIHQDQRGRGFGSLLLKAAEEWCTKRGAEVVELQVADKNEDGKKFWKRHGFEESTIHMIKIL